MCVLSFPRLKTALCFAFLDLFMLNIFTAELKKQIGCLCFGWNGRNEDEETDRRQSRGQNVKIKDALGTLSKTLHVEEHCVFVCRLFEACMEKQE